jgi:hypothetical protein
MGKKVMGLLVVSFFLGMSFFSPFLPAAEIGKGVKVLATNPGQTME